MTKLSTVVAAEDRQDHTSRELPRFMTGTGSQRLGYRDASRILCIPIGTLRSMVCRRQIPHIRVSSRIVLFDVFALEAWLSERTVPIANGNSRTDCLD